MKNSRYILLLGLVAILSITLSSTAWPAGALVVTGPNNAEGTAGWPIPVIPVLSLDDIYDGDTLLIEGITGISRTGGADDNTFVNIQSSYGANPYTPGTPYVPENAYTGAVSQMVVVKTGDGVLILGGTGDNNSLRLDLQAGTVVMAKTGTGASTFSQVNNVSAGATLVIGTQNDRYNGGSNNEGHIWSTISEMNGTFDMNGYSEILTGLTGTGRIINSDSSKTSTLKVTGASTFSGVFGVEGDVNQSNLHISIVINGERDLTTANYHTGGTTLVNSFVNLTAAANQGYFGDINSEIRLNGTTIGIKDFACTFDRDIVLEGAGGGFRMRSSGKLDIAGEISGSGNLWVSYDGSYANNTVSLSNKNTYTGKTVIGALTNAYTAGSATLVLNHAEALPEATTLSFGNQYSGSYLNMNGHNATVSGAEGNGHIRSGTLTVNDSVNLSFAPELDATSAVVKTGTATMTLTPRTAAFDNNFTVQNGNLRINENAGLKAADRILIQGDSGLVVGTDSTWSLGTIGNAAKGTAAVVADGYVDSMTPYVNAWHTSSAASNGLWENNSTKVFTTTIEVLEPTQFQFWKAFDDWGMISLTPINADGTLDTAGKVDFLPDGAVGDQLDNTHNNVMISTETQVFEPGIYQFEVRAGQGTGGVGAFYGTDKYTANVFTGNTLGFGMKLGYDAYGAAALANATDFKAMDFDENGALAGFDSSIIRTTGFDREVNGTFTIAPDTTFTVSVEGTGSATLLGTMAGDGTLRLNPAAGSIRLESANSHTGGTEFVDTLTVANAGAFGVGTVRPDGAATLVLDVAAEENIANDFLVGAGDSLRVSAASGNKALLTGNLGGAGQLVFDLSTLNPGSSLFDLGTLDLSGGLEIAVAGDPNAWEGTLFNLIMADSITPQAGMSVEDTLASAFAFSESGDLWNYGVTGDGMLWLGNGISPNDAGGAVPEPGTWVLMMLSLACGGSWAICHRRRNA